MFRRSDRELEALQQELLAVEEEEYEEEEWEEEFEDEAYDEEYDEFDDDEPDYEDGFESDYEEEYTQEQFQRQVSSRYGRGSPRKFDDDDFFDEGFDDTDVLFRKDYKKAKRKKRRRTFGLLLLAVLELGAIGAILLWFMSWIQ